MVRLLERDGVLAELAGLWEQAAAGRGALVLVGGEAGIGKTAVVRAFCDENVAGPVLWGRCDPMGTPRPLGPLVDVAQQVGGELGEMAGAGAAAEILFPAVLELLRDQDCPKVIVVEDVHWADEATLDWLRYGGSRIGSAHGLVLVTFRDDLGVGHPLRVALGDLASSPAVRRVTLSPLSVDAVGTLAAGTEVDAGALHRVTGGNPFFVTEVLAAGGGSIPDTVRDAVLARVVRLPPVGRDSLEMSAVIGAVVPPLWRKDFGLLDSVGIDACVRAGMLVADGAALRFRHEIARVVVDEAIEPGRRQRLHAQVLEVLSGEPVGDADTAVLAYHAEAAGDREAVLEFAPEAAARASRLGAHREAAVHYERALRFSEGLPDEVRAAIYEALAGECQLTGRLTDAVAAARAAMALREQGRDVRALGRSQRRLATLLWSAAEKADAKPLALAAIATLSSLEPDGELAAAYVALASLHMQAAEASDAERWAGLAQRLAEDLGDVGALVGALRVLGAARLCGPSEDGWPQLERSLQLALAQDPPAMAAGCYQGLVWFAAMHRQFSYVERYLPEALTFCDEHELVWAAHGMKQARCVELAHRGHWSEATELATTLLGESPSLVDQIQPLYVLGRLRARRGDPDPWPPLDEALALSAPRSELQHVGNVRAIRAEAAWLAGDTTRMVAEAGAAYELALASQDPWILGDLALWLWRGDALDVLPEVVAPHPYGLQIRGDWAGAAAGWERLGCPFEMAAALLDADQAGPVRRAWQVFDGLGSRPAAGMAARRLRALGVSGTPRGPRHTTRESPYGLTARQREVLALLAEGLTDAQIADRLFVSTRTVNHHVASILAKLEVTSRAEAARIEL